jgi:hypothetical protein
MAHRVKLALLLAPAALVAATATAQQGGAKFNTTLSGTNEVPPTSETATGSAVITVNAGQGQVCWEITTTGFDPATESITAAHIHSGLAGANGGIVVHLAATMNGTNKACTSVVGGGNNTALSRDLLDAIRKSPQAFYVNVHTNIFPNGAIRGQLSK